VFGEIRESGRTVILVTRDMTSVRPTVTAPCSSRREPSASSGIEEAARQYLVANFEANRLRRRRRTHAALYPDPADGGAEVEFVPDFLIRVKEARLEDPAASRDRASGRRPIRVRAVETRRELVNPRFRPRHPVRRPSIFAVRMPAGDEEEKIVPVGRPIEPSQLREPTARRRHRGLLGDHARSQHRSPSR
jgi:hypothetical protein